MMKRTFLASLLMTGLTLGLVGCDSSEKKDVEPKIEEPVAKPGPAAEPGPVQPSPTPEMPNPNAKPSGEMKDEAKPEPKKDEPKVEPASPK